ncbi:hypothetical protein ACGFZ9_41290 [Streptomyces mirabilis]
MLITRGHLTEQLTKIINLATPPAQAGR